MFDENIDTSGPKRLVLMRVINRRALGYAKTPVSKDTQLPVYITPETDAAIYGINLETIQSCLLSLTELSHIEIDQYPDNNLPFERRIKKDDERDYYLISVNESFFNYYKILEASTPFLNASDTTTPIEKNEAKIITKKKRKAKVFFNENTRKLTYGEKDILITGPLQIEICKQVFKSRKISVFYDDILEVVDVNKKTRSVKDSVKLINAKIKEIFGLDELLISREEEVKISKPYL